MTRGPQPTDRGPVVVRHLLETGPHGRRASEASSAAPHHSHYSLNHPPTPPPYMEKLSSMKLVPGDKNVGDRS